MKNSYITYKRFTSDSIKILITTLLATTLLSACGGGSSEDKTPEKKQPDKVIVDVSKCLETALDAKTACIDIDGRKAILYKNDGSVKGGIALFLHGAPGTASKVMGIFDAKMIANKHNLVAISPQGLESTWGWLSVNSSSTNNNSDVEYINALLTKVRSEHNINSDKLYIFGYSAGGFMAYKLACDIPEQISAVVSVAGQYRGSLAACENNTPLAIHHFHSTSDEAVPYNGRALGGIKSVDETIKIWRDKNGCNQEATSQTHIGVTSNSSKTTTFTYDNCLASVTLSKMAFVPHEANYIGENLYQIYQYIFNN